MALQFTAMNADETSEVRFQAIFENAGIGIAIVDMAGHPVKSNPALQEMLGYREEELCRMRFTEFTHPDDAKMDLDLYAELIAGRRNRYEIEKRYIRKDGRTLWGQLTVSMIRDPAGHPQYAIGMVMNINERRLAEEALHASQSRLQAILDNSPALIFLKDVTGRYLQVNREFERCFNLTQEQILGRNDAEIFPPQQAASFSANDRRVIEAGHPLEFEEFARYGDGLHANIVYKFPLRDVAGRICALGGIATDISERKRAEDDLRRQKEILQNIFDHIPVMLSFAGDDGHIKLVNLEWERELGWSLEELQRQNLDLLAECHPDPKDRQVVLQLIAAANGEWTDFSQRVRGGRVIDTTWAVTRLSDGTIMSIGMDITERKRSESMLKQAKEQLQRLSRRLLELQEAERRHLSRELHDEIGQALTALKINLQAVQRCSDSSTFIPRLEDSISIVDRTLRQVRNLALDLRPSLLDDLGLCAALRWYADQQEQRTGLRIQFKAYAPDARLESTLATACFRVAQEALTNVVRHAQAQAAWVELEEQDGFLCLRVRDDGLGFDQEVVRRQLAHGASMGLLGMEERVLFLGGQFDIESAPNRGTTVQARFPITPL
jgi:PAS domain S-box-containing protein